MMDSHSDFLGKNFSERPIVLSPPPVDQVPSAFARQNPGPAQNYHPSRNQSVGYNLQQEFEALKADLDLDLSHTEDGGRKSGEVGGSVGTGMSRPDTAPGNLTASTKTSTFGTTAPPLADTLMRESTLTPPVTSASAGPSGTNSVGLRSLLINKGSSGFMSPLGSAHNRPQSVNDFSTVLGQQSSSPFSGMRQPVNFYSDVLSLTNWIENLNPQELMTLLDHWCGNLPFDILLTMKSALESHLNSGMQVPAVFSSKPNNFQQYPNGFVSDMESLSVENSVRDVSMAGSKQGLAQPKPKPNNSTLRSHLFADTAMQRPKSADPSLHNRFHPPMSGAAGVGPGPEGTRSPASHLYEKTSFLQQAAASNSPHAHGSGQQNMPGVEEGLDLSATSKLGALVTINSRVALDFNRKPFSPGSNRGHSAASYEESLQRQSKSSSVPANAQKYSAAAMAGAPSGVKAKKDADLALKPKNSASSSQGSSGCNAVPNDISSLELLQNIPAWLKLLRLHKYTDCLKDVYWKDLVELNDEELEEKGIKALGARRKLLKAFETVKQANP